MAAAAQAFADFTTPVTPSRTISRFLSLPRWPSAPEVFEFGSSYLVHNALTTLIPLIAGVALIILSIIHITIRHSCRAVSTDARSAHISKHPTFSKLQILLSALVLTAVTIFLSLGLLGNAALTFSVDDALDVINGLVADLSRLGFAFLDTAILLENRIRSFSVENKTLPASLQTSIGDQITPTFQTLRDFAVGGFPDVEPLRIELNVLVTEIGDVLRVISKITDIVYGVALAIIFLVALAPLLLILSDVKARKMKRGRRWPQYLFIIPILLAWLLVGVSQSAGIIVSDVCVSLHEYRQVLLGGNAPTTANAFIDSGFTCPSAELAGEIQTRIRDTASSITQSVLARETVELLLEEPAERVSAAAAWSGGQAARLANCSTQVDFSGKLEFIACGKEGASAAEGLFDLFVAFLGLALCLHLALFLGLFGLEVARYLFVWRMPDLEESDDVFKTSSGGEGRDVAA